MRLFTETDVRAKFLKPEFVGEHISHIYGTLIHWLGMSNNQESCFIFGPNTMESISTFLDVFFRQGARVIPRQRDQDLHLLVQVRTF